MTKRATKDIATSACQSSAGRQFRPQIGTRITLPSGQVVIVAAIVRGEATCAYLERVRGEVSFSLQWLLKHGRIC